MSITGADKFTDFAVDGTYAYITSEVNDCVYRVALSGSTSAATVFAGQANSAGFEEGGTGTSKLWDPMGICFDGTALYVADSSNLRIRRVTLGGEVSTYVGSGTLSGIDGNGTVASFKVPMDVTSDGNGNLFVADHGAQKIRWVNSNRDVVTIAGSGKMSSTDGVGADGSFLFPYSIAFGKINGTEVLFVGEEGTGKIRVVTDWK